ncbi:nitrate reductase cytochrome c-type subunit [Parendozoicomonas haliclonae]|uniref:Periplasmic nitrate reductase, electron transfer subunit n=1 Tax=Parendozoicomonas haliclonae TaxID=1960125 RepID=A0A1X7AH81_9GAMM|nr:nitrate reductase cytochrome c-type subunit [Parendozoicomonas haliclonae]SMA35088.1 Periplasmic nitrate reductase, electron transfer subunit precursor [Parendozoicomonas haliclonae]
MRTRNSDFRVGLKGLLATLAVCMSMVSFQATAAPAGESSIRNNSDLTTDAPAEPMKKMVDTDVTFDRDFVEQPPLIPHDIRGYQVDKNVNKCLTCHSWKNAKKWKATRISITHFKDRDGNQLADVAPNRYFCLQCHVPQADTKPLIENKFKPVESLK